MSQKREPAGSLFLSNTSKFPFAEAFSMEQYGTELESSVAGNAESPVGDGRRPVTNLLWNRHIPYQDIIKKGRALRIALFWLENRNCLLGYCLEILPVQLCNEFDIDPLGA